MLFSQVMLFSVLLGTSTIRDEEAAAWPDFRGPRGDGHAIATARPPVEWSEERYVTWKTPVHGLGWSSPVVVDGQVWMTTGTEDGHRLSVVAVDLASGAVVHDRVLFEVDEPQFRNALNSHASPSPVAMPGRVFVHFGAYGTAALDSRTGETVWQRRDLPCQHLMGPGSSPVLVDGRLVLTFDGADRQVVVGLDPATGETLWETPRSTDFTNIIPDQRKAYGTPFVAEVDGQRQLVSVGAQAAFGLDPRTGVELWQVRIPGYSMSSRPFAGRGLTFINTGFDRPQLWAIRLGGLGDVTESHVAWKETRSLPTIASKVLVDDRIYLVSDGGVLGCLKADTGETIWRERIGGRFCASPIVAGGHVYFFDREGMATVIVPEDEYRLVAQNSLEAGCMASPAVIGNALIVRTTSHLYRIEGPKRADSKR